jgi:hypothetical protein
MKESAVICSVLYDILISWVTLSAAPPEINIIPLKISARQRRIFGFIFSAE